MLKILIGLESRRRKRIPPKGLIESIQMYIRKLYYFSIKGGGNVFDWEGAKYMSSVRLSQYKCTSKYYVYIYLRGNKGVVMYMIGWGKICLSSVRFSRYKMYIRI